MNKKHFLAVVVFGVFIGIGTLLMPTNEPANQAPNNGHKVGHLVDNGKPVGGDFTLTSVNGKQSLSDFKDKLVLIYFGYTYCPDICPTNLGNLSVAYRQFTPEEREQLQILFVSVDPERDTPERLKQYADYFEANIIGMTGTPENIAEISRRYGVVYAKVDDPNNGTNYAVDHSAFTYVIDQQGVWQTQLQHATTPDVFVQTVRQYLNN